jgi:hypothetical protein
MPVNPWPRDFDLRPGAIIRLEPGESFEAFPLPEYRVCEYCARPRLADDLSNCYSCGAPPSIWGAKR